MFNQMMNWMQKNKILPQISDTERQALEAGDVWIDGQLFGGNLDFDKVLNENYDALSTEEQAFLDGPVEELMNMVDAYEVSQSRVIPDHIMDFIKSQGFLSMQIAKEYGGNPMSTLAKSSVMAKLGTTAGAVTSIVVIANSLGAAELLGHYGTDDQKKHFLPRLANGELMPCFGLTEPTAGSDAASIKAEGIVFKDSDGETKIKLNFRKRYITLAPIANLVSLAVRVEDPENLLGKGTEPGITVVLVEVGEDGVPGLTIGEHHEPVGEAFYNGPIVGKDVIVPAKDILGGIEYAGKGWKMLMESLAGGRMVSLPAAGISMMRHSAMAAGAYSMVREQFGISIGQMEGVQAKVGHIAGMSYMFDAARIFGCSAVDQGIQPPVVSAIMKAYSTQIGRELAVDAMDVLAGSGVMQGPNNIMGGAYKSAPVPVTVEGANIMTRTLMIFGQGATRCHPYAYNVVEAVENSDTKAFKTNLVGWMKQFAGGGLMSLLRGLTRGYFTVKLPNAAPENKSFYRRLGWSATRYGFLTNLAMFMIGGKLKVRGNLTGRYADALAWMYLAISALRRYEAEGRKPEDLPLVQYSCEYALTQTQQAYEGIYQNFDGIVGLVLKTIGRFMLAVNPLAKLPSDELTRKTAQTIQQYNEQYLRVAQGQHIPEDQSIGMGRLLKAFELRTQADAVKAKIRQAQKQKKLPRGKAEEVAAQAQTQGFINKQEAELLLTAQQACLEAIEVDVFSKDEFFGVNTTEEQTDQAA